MRSRERNTYDMNEEMWDGVWDKDMGSDFYSN